MSSTTTDDEVGSSYILYKDRADWKDVHPIPSDEGPFPVVAIDYSEQFADVYDYIRGVIKSGDLSDRVLGLTSDGITLNAANYTVWQLRRDCLENLGIPKLVDENGLDPEFEKEFSFCEKIIEDNQKNYQVWHHQKALVTYAVGYDEVSRTMKVTNEEHRNLIFNRELRLTKHVLGFDAKNYHAWQHRQWVLSVFRKFSSELDYVNSLLAKDVRNNSAWNQRYFVFVNLLDFSEEALMKEINQTWNFIRFAYNNESPWSYLRGLINLTGKHKVSVQKDIISRCKTLMKQCDVYSVPMLALYVHIVDDLSREREIDSDTFIETLTLLDNLVEKIDPIRASYWKYVKQKLMTARPNDEPSE